MPNGLGTPVGYKLVPSASFPPLLDPASPAYQRAEVIGHTLWVTPYREDERWPCGDFPVQSEHDSGLAAWTRADRPIEDTDVVLWYVFGIHHITRPEDWPVMVDLGDWDTPNQPHSPDQPRKSNKLSRQKGQSFQPFGAGACCARTAVLAGV